MPPSSPTAVTQGGAAAAAVSLPIDAVFDILSRAPVKSVCRFRCVSREWRDLISDPAFLAEHKSRHPDPFLVDTGSFHHDGPVDLRLMAMDGSLVRVIKGAGGSGVLRSTSLDDLICIYDGSSGGFRVVDPATGEVLATCPMIEARKRGMYHGILTRCYTTFCFGRAVPSGAYKMVRLVEDRSCEILTLGDDAITVAGWRQVQAHPIVSGHRINYVPIYLGSSICINGIMYLLTMTTMSSNDTLLCLDLESEQWRKKVLEGPWNIVGEDEWRTRTNLTHITELSGSLCMVQSELIENPCTNIWLLANPDNGVWIKAYTIPMASYLFSYIIPLRDTADGKLLLRCSDSRRRCTSVLQVYDSRTGKCTDFTGTLANHAGGIGLCTLHLERLVTARNRRRL